MKVPFNDLNVIHKEIKDKVLKNFNSIIDGNSFLLSKEVAKFEQNFSDFSNSKYTTSCSSGTDALELILRALDLGPGDEVILPTNSFVATCFAVMNIGATPVFVDCDEYYLIDTKDVEKKLTNKTKAVIAVNLYGQIANIKALYEISKKSNLFLIQDSAQSHGARSSYNHNSLTTASAYSFYPGKNLGAWGDAGAVTTNNKSLSVKIKSLSNQGSIKIALKYDTYSKEPVIKKLERVSKPGLRKYSDSGSLPRVLNGLGIAIVSTSKGLMTGKKAKQSNIGGEILCYVH